jgi:hypothetical protein
VWVTSPFKSFVPDSNAAKAPAVAETSSPPNSDCPPEIFSTYVLVAPGATDMGPLKFTVGILPPPWQLEQVLPPLEAGFPE